MPLDKAPPRTNRFGSPLVLSRLHWARPELVVEVQYLTWTDDNLLRQVVYQGLREDKSPSEGAPSLDEPTSSASSNLNRRRLLIPFSCMIQQPHPTRDPAKQCLTPIGTAPRAQSTGRDRSEANLAWGSCRPTQQPCEADRSRQRCGDLN